MTPSMPWRFKVAAITPTCASSRSGAILTNRGSTLTVPGGQQLAALCDGVQQGVQCLVALQRARRFLVFGLEILMVRNRIRVDAIQAGHGSRRWRAQWAWRHFFRCSNPSNMGGLLPEVPALAGCCASVCCRCRYRDERLTFAMKASRPSLLKPSRLIKAWALGKRNMRWLGVAGLCQRGDRADFNKPGKPMAPRPSMHFAFLSSPAANPTRFGKVSPASLIGSSTLPAQ